MRERKEGIEKESSKSSKQRPPLISGSSLISQSEGPKADCKVAVFITARSA